MAVYDPLRAYLQRNGAARVPMTFAQVEAVAGHKLPRSAYKHRPWWANEQRGHSHAKAWLEAGYETEQVDMAGRKLVFRRSTAGSSSGGMAEENEVFVHGERRQRHHPLIGCMKGTFWVDPEWDLTKPALEPEAWKEIQHEMLAKYERAFRK